MSAYASPFAGVDYQEEDLPPPSPPPPAPTETTSPAPAPAPAPAAPPLDDKDPTTTTTLYENDAQEEKKMGLEEVRALQDNKQQEEKQGVQVELVVERESFKTSKQQGQGLQLQDRSPVIEVPTTLSRGSQVDLPSLLQQQQQQGEENSLLFLSPTPPPPPLPLSAARKDLDKSTTRWVTGLLVLLFVLYGWLMMTLVISSGSFCTGADYDYSGLGRQLHVWTSTRLVMEEEDPEEEDPEQYQEEEKQPSSFGSWWSALWALRAQQHEQYLMAYAQHADSAAPAAAPTALADWAPQLICPVTAWTCHWLQKILLPRSYTLLLLNLQAVVQGTDEDFTRQWSSHMSQVEQDEEGHRQVALLKNNNNNNNKGRNFISRLFRKAFSRGAAKAKAKAAAATRTRTRNFFVSGVVTTRSKPSSLSSSRAPTSPKEKKKQAVAEEEEEEAEPSVSFTHQEEALLWTQDDLTETQVQLVQQLYTRSVHLLQGEDLQQCTGTRTQPRSTTVVPFQENENENNKSHHTKGGGGADLATRFNQVVWGGPREKEEDSTAWWLPLLHDGNNNTQDQQQPDDVLQWDGARLLHRYLKIMGWPEDLKCKFPFRLCAKGCDCEVALAHTLEWRLKYQPWKMTAMAIKENALGWIYHRGHAREPPNLGNSTTFATSAANAMVWYRPGLQKLNHSEAYMRAVFHTLDAAIADTQHRSAGRNGKYHIVVDFASFSFAQLPPWGDFKRTIAMMQDHYPDRLGVVLLVNLWGAGRWIIQLLLPLLSEAVRRKIFLVPSLDDNKKRRAVLKRVVAPQWIPTWLGGTDEYTFDPEEYYATTQLWTEEEGTAYRKSMPHHA